jgi:transcriptional regulator with XRE-family HTH domain
LDGGVAMSDMLAIFRARKAQLGLSNSQLEEIADLGEGNASKILSGDRDPRAGTLERICRALKLQQNFVPIIPEKVASDFGEGSQLSDAARNQRR